MSSKRTYQRRKYGPRKPTSMYLKKNKDRQQDNQIKQLKRAVNENINFINDYVSPVGVDDAGTIGSFTVPVNGNTDATRLGDKIRYKSLWLNWSASAGDATNLFRMIIFKWKENTAVATPTVGDILQQHSATPSGPNLVLSNYVSSDAKRKKFKVIYDKTVTLTTSGTNQVVRLSKTFKESQLGSFDFNGTASTGIGKLYFFMISDSGAVAHPQVKFNAISSFYP